MAQQQGVVACISRARVEGREEREAIERKLIRLAWDAAAAARADLAAGRLAPRADPARRYRGVRKPRPSSYGVEIRVPALGQRRLWLGAFRTAEEAAYAYDAAQRAIRGARAKLNFPGREIPAAAAAAAEGVNAAGALVAHVAAAEQHEPAVQQPPAPALPAPPVVAAPALPPPVAPPVPEPVAAPAPAIGGGEPAAHAAPALLAVKVEPEDEAPLPPPPQAPMPPPRAPAPAPAAPAAAPPLVQAAAPRQRAAAPSYGPMPKPPVPSYPCLRAPAPHLFRYREASAGGPAGMYFYRPPTAGQHGGAAPGGGGGDGPQ
ncbi:hypothetical protein ACP4OV_014146 [Aristida adscensionis]